MNTQKAIKSRRAIKKFDANHQMSKKTEHKILSLGMLAPTAFNIQNWRFVVVRDKKLRQEIQQSAYGQEQVVDSSLFIVLCADLRSWEKQPNRYWADAGQEVSDTMLPMIDGYYRGKEQVQRDEAMRSCGIAAQTLMLAAKSLGYDSCPMDGFDFDAVAKQISLPDDHVVTMFVAIGKAAASAYPRGGQLDIDEIVIKDRF